MKEGDVAALVVALELVCGSSRRGQPLLHRCGQVLESLPPGPELAMAYCDRADLDMEAHEADSAIDSAQRAIALAEPGRTI